MALRAVASHVRYSASVASGDIVAAADYIIPLAEIISSPGFIESVDADDAMVFILEWIRSDTATASDANAKTISPAKADTATASDANAKIISPAKADTVTISELVITSMIGDYMVNGENGQANEYPAGGL